MAQKVVVIGGVATGPKAAARLRRLDPSADITIIERDDLVSYAGCGTPYYIKGDIAEFGDLIETPVGTPRDAVFFRKVKNIRVLVRTLAQRIDRAEKVVTTLNVDTGEQQDLPYDKLVLATGGTPFLPPIPGIDLKRVFTLRSPHDASAIRDAIGSGRLKQAVIVGAGLIGLEMCEALVARGLQVTVVEMFPHLLPGLLDVETAAFVARQTRAQGINGVMGEGVVALEGDHLGNVKRVVTERQSIETDVVIMAVGVRPNDQLARDAGIEVAEKGGIIVNEYMQTSDPEVYAGGDCVLCRHLVSGQMVYVPLGSTANKHGRVIGTNLAGGRETFPGILGTAVAKHCDFNIGCTGLTEKKARELGYSVVTALAPAPDHAHYYPGAQVILVKLVADADTRKVLGVQVVGPGDADKRVDVVASALHFGATVDDLATLDLGYAPPYSGALDNVIHAANIIRNKLDGVAKAVSPTEVRAKMDAVDGFVLLDVRGPSEYEAMRIEDPRVTLIPLGKLRDSLDQLPRDKEIIPFCKISLRGYEAQRILEGAGFGNVRFMDGGVVAWPYELVTEDAE
jgi:NADPH-dependent 2,4-dienoyl-CoA reductase/sulfur reductase-like enzyme/rhodanese-related sulfurtransferase